MTKSHLRIAEIDNGSDRSIVLFNPHSKDDSLLVEKDTAVKTTRYTNLNVIKDCTDYQTAILDAINVYGKMNNFCFWDDGSGKIKFIAEGIKVEAVDPKDLGIKEAMTLHIDPDGWTHFTAFNG